ncbi:voltage-dependent T-type calcium channel subunit alpha-1H [Elysia marginata]|uniref:Voltage-dependent T-type calcium channel subunit alpha-1H n=1 Tax=Elysia marginata TaxID=1093978 RepID=A0AAV4GZ42_9GAST|nr:voltage-dependent T-type calcium channel subunit alpha-1H [Elysia marginata]
MLWSGLTLTGQPGLTLTGQPGLTLTGQPGLTLTGQPGLTLTGQPGLTLTGQSGITLTGQSGLTLNGKSGLTLKGKSSLTLPGQRGRVVSASDSRSGGRGFDSRPCRVAVALGKQFTLTFPSPPTCKIGTQLQAILEFAICACNTLQMGLKWP